MLLGNENFGTYKIKNRMTILVVTRTISLSLNFWKVKNSLKEKESNEADFDFDSFSLKFNSERSLTQST